MQFRKKAFLLSIFVFFVFALTSPGETPYNYFELLSKAFLQGNFYITDGAPYLNELIPIEDSKFYVPYAPMPAILMLPFILIGITSQTLVSHVLGTAITYLSILISFEITKDQKRSLVIGLIIGIGTTIWYLASVGSSWYMGQLTGIFFLSLAIYLKLINKNAIFIGLALGAAYLARPHMILSLPFFVLYKFNFKNSILLAIGLMPEFLFNFYYNFARFGVPWDAGYYRIPGVLEEVWFKKEIFHYSYISRNLEAIFLYMPDKVNKFPYLVPDYKGLALWIVTPSAFLLSKLKLNKLNYLALITIFLISLPLLMHGTVGFSQFGYRFANDLLPFFVILLASSVKSIKLKHIYLVLFVSIFINAWGVLTLNVFRI